MLIDIIGFDKIPSMNIEAGPNIGSWESYGGGVFRRESSFPDGKRVLEKKITTGFKKESRQETYPDGMERFSSFTDREEFLKNIGSVALLESIAPPVEIRYQFDGTQVSLFFSDDGQTHILMSFGEFGTSWVSRNHSTFIYANYDTEGKIANLSLKTDEIKEKIEHEEFDDSYAALHELMSYIDHDLDEYSGIIQGGIIHLNEQIERFSSDQNTLDFLRGFSSILYERVLDMIDDPIEREKADVKLKKIGLEDDILYRLLVEADPGETISRKALEDIESGEFIKDIISSSVDVASRSNRFYSKRRVSINVSNENEFTYRETELDSEKELEGYALVAEDKFEWDEVIKSQDMEISFSINENMLKILWKRSDRQVYMAEIPYKLTDKNAYKIAKDPDADFRVVRDLIPASLQKVV